MMLNIKYKKKCYLKNHYLTKQVFKISSSIYFGYLKKYKFIVESNK